jgi:hypothetical protein
MDNPGTHEWLGRQDPGAREANYSLYIPMTIVNVYFFFGEHIDNVLYFKLTRIQHILLYTLTYTWKLTVDLTGWKRNLTMFSHFELSGSCCLNIIFCEVFYSFLTCPCIVSPSIFITILDLFSLINCF